MGQIRKEEASLFTANEAEVSKALAGIQMVLKVLNDYYSKDAAHISAGDSSTRDLYS